jgi:uncharacterized protein (DUF58 family)
MKWFAGAVLILAAGAALRLGLPVYAMYALLGAIVAGRWLAMQWSSRVQVTRDCDRSEAQIGEIVTVNVTIKNGSRITVPWLLLEDYIPWGAVAAIPARLRRKGIWNVITKLRGGGVTTLSYQVECLMRGYYPIGPLLIETGDPFGLHRRFRTAGEPHYVMTPPRIVPMEGYDLATPRPIGEVRIVHRLFEDPTLISGIRDYQNGDPMNRIHWRATARTGKLQCKKYEPSCIVGVVMLLDFHSESLRGDGELMRTELAATAAASLANAVIQTGKPAGLITNGRDAADRIREEGWESQFGTRRQARARAKVRDRNDRLRPLMVEPRRGQEQLARILETLARLEPTDGLTFAQLLEESDARLPRNATIVALAQQIDEDAMLALVGLHRRGYSVTVAQIAFDPKSATPDWAEFPETIVGLIAAGIRVRRVTDDASLSHLCSEQWAR